MNASKSVGPSDPRVVFFQETKPDDIDKYFKRSNFADSGGGARDLRIRPSKQFWDGLKPFFPDEITLRRRKGTVFSTERSSGKTISQTVSLWGPTNTRDEVRIAKLYTIPGWEIDSSRFAKDDAAGVTWFYLLVIDSEGQVWARTMRSASLGKNHPGFVACVEAALKAKDSAKKTTRGIYYFPK